MRGTTTFGTDLGEVSLHEAPAEREAHRPSHTREKGGDEAAGLELFRRACTERDDAAWHLIVEVYRGLLLRAVRRHAVRSLGIESDGFYVDRAFERFWHATRSGRAPQFNDLASVRKYLKLCLGSVLLDEARARHRRPGVPIDAVSPDTCVGPDPSAQVIGRLARGELWAAIVRELVDDNEQLVAHLSFVAGLSPREILARHPNTFPSVVEIYRIKRTLLERLRRSRTIRQRLEGCLQEM